MSFLIYEIYLKVHITVTAEPYGLYSVKAIYHLTLKMIYLGKYLKLLRN